MCKGKKESASDPTGQSKPDTPSEGSADLYERIVDRAHKEIDGVRSVYKWLAGMLAVILSTGIGAATLLTYKSVTHMQSFLEERADQLARRVEARIDAQFEDKNIRTLVQQKAEERIDKVADQIIAERIRTAIDVAVSELRAEVTATSSLQKQVHTEVQATQKKLKKLESDTFVDLRGISEFHMTVISALTDDRHAFDRLKEISDDKAHRFSREAGATWRRILDEHASSIFVSDFTVPWTDGVDPSTLSIAQLRRNYEKALSPYLRRALVEYVWGRGDIPKKERMQFLVGVMRTDQSLMVVEYAGRYFKEASGLKLKPLAVPQFVQWWEENKDKPIATDSD